VVRVTKYRGNMKRAYYSKKITDFINDSEEYILGHLSLNHTNFALEELQINAWISQIKILKKQLLGLDGYIYFEFAIPRMRKRVDNVLILGDTVFVIEFKVGENKFPRHAIDQVIDYATDLKNFHEGSHRVKLIPVLVSTNAKQEYNHKINILEMSSVIKVNEQNIKESILPFINYNATEIDVEKWEESSYKPTPTIVEAAQALYNGHNVNEITRSDSGAINLTNTTDTINKIVEKSKLLKRKSICFITGVPGAGKTLAGLNIANERMDADKNEHAVFLSGNGPLVQVLREALTRDEVEKSKKTENKLTKKQAAIKVNAFIQNIHHFRDEYLKDTKAPVEKVVVFDEAQRAWTNNKTSSFMKKKKGIENFNKSEPEFLIEVMDRHTDWCVIICLIGGGQEIHTGEAGLEEWIRALKLNYDNWALYFSDFIVKNKNYLKTKEMIEWVKINGKSDINLHLNISVRSFRSEKLSEFIYELLELNNHKAIKLFKKIKTDYPIVITRDLDKAKKWLMAISKGNERLGIISSSGARRLKPKGVDVKNKIDAPNWFLNNKEDIRSSYFLEDIATEFDIQGLEIDYSCIAWGANFYFDKTKGDWVYRSFKGTKWQKINKISDKEYLKNSYRVLLTRARQGFVIFIPNGECKDKTRLPEFYDSTFEYLKEIGITEL